MIRRDIYWTNETKFLIRRDISNHPITACAYIALRCVRPDASAVYLAMAHNAFNERADCQRFEFTPRVAKFQCCHFLRFQL